VAVEQAINVVEQLRIEANPFVPRASGARMGRPLQTALGEVIRQIGLETPLVVVVGSAGTGKTLLAKMAARACSDMGLSVRRADHGDLVDGAAGEKLDVLLLDEADSMMDSTLRMLLPGGGKRPATTTVLLCRPASVRRFISVVDAAVVSLTRLSPSDTRSYLLERASSVGGPDLFAPAALDLIVDASGGIPRSLWAIASLAYFSAASDGSLQIGHQHVADALASQFISPESQHPATPSAPPYTPAVERAIEHPKHAPASDPSDDSWQISHQHVADAPASQFIFPEVDDAATASAPLATPLATPSVETGRESPEHATPSDRPPFNLVRADAAIEGNPWRLVGVTIAFAAAFAVAVVIPAILLFENSTGATNSDRPPVAVLDVPKPLGGAPAGPIRPVISSTSVANQPSPANTTAEAADAARKTASRSAPAMEPAGQSPANAKSANSAKGGSDAAVRVQTAIGADAAKKDAEKPTQVQTISAVGIGNQGTISTEAADQELARANATAQMIEAQQAADRAKAAKEAADQAKAAKDAADQANAAKQTADQAKAAKDTADQANAAKQAASQANAAVLRAKIAKDAADRVNAAMQVSAQAQIDARAKADAEAARETADREKRKFRNSLFGVRE